ncbi:MAG: hypothetical protein V4494_00495, partial [Chlamydiota bacterium]
MRGLIPGPSESRESFFERVDRVQSNLSKNNVSSEDWLPAKKITQSLFGFSPDWVQAQYSNKNLLPWEGAAVWVGFSFNIQLREKFRKGSYLGIYQRNEVLAHEAVHAARMAFEEPCFEEVFAYLTSSNRWRKISGPFFRSPKETLFFVLMLGFSLLGIIFFNDLFGFLPLVILFLGVLRLVGIRRIFSRAFQKCKKIINGNPYAFLLHLTDKEIFLFAEASQENIYEYVNAQTSIRWEMIR